MIKTIFLVFLVFFTLQARENPFFHETNLEQLPYTSNEDMNLPPLRRAAISLPSTARTIEKVTVTYKTLNGAIEEKSIELGNSVDWHLPIFISQNYVVSETKTRKKTVYKPIKKEKKVIKEVKKREVVKEIKNQIITNEIYKVIGKRKYITFSSLNNKLKLTTDNELLRDFLLVKPHRLVLDFKKDSTAGTYIKKNPNNPFKVIKIGSHEKYFRVVIELDGYYRYKLEKTLNGYIIELK
ncbi:MAG: AMIN domain-containing protein [Campylobacterota bacterium]|nr:AMIN domain-containing protein [Campylobacterota bacterium]